ncbi:MAG: radical SAM protein [Acidobacteriota bacterium]
MRKDSLKQGPAILLEPDINPITLRFGLPQVANYPPLAQVRLAGQIQDDHLRVVDLRIPGERDLFLNSLRTDPPLLVGISLTFTSNGDEAMEIATCIRRASPETVIVLGGTGPSEDPESFLDADVDLIGYRKGDASLNYLIRELRKTGRIPDSPPGFFQRSGGTWVKGDSLDAPAMEDLMPGAWHLLPRRYWKHYFQGFRPTGMGQTSEGCPFDCTFCSVWKVHGRKVNVASLANVQHDFLSLPDFVRGFFFADDIWLQATEPQRVGLYDRLLKWMVDEYLPRRRDTFWMTVETRTDLFLRQEARFQEWLEKGSLKWILFGVEAVTDQQLKAYSKRNTVDTNSQAIRKAAELGALITGQFVIPCDADRTYFDEIVRFLEDHKQWIRVANFTIATPLPGTDLYSDLLPQFPELADRKVVTHPAFSLFTALSPMRLEPEEFYRQVARVYKAANHVHFTWESVRQAWNMTVRSPWLIPRVLKMPFGLRALTRASTFLQTHREVQGERLMAPLPKPGNPEIPETRVAAS